MKKINRYVNMVSAYKSEKNMERIGKIIVNSCGYTVLCLAIYYAFGGTVGAVQFFLSLLFGFIVSMSNFLFGNANVKPWISLLGAYVIAAIAFFLCILLGYNYTPTAAGKLVGMVLFTVLYFIAVGVSRLVKRTVLGEEKAKGAKASTKTNKKSNYKSLYKD